MSRGNPPLNFPRHKLQRHNTILSTFVIIAAVPFPLLAILTILVALLVVAAVYCLIGRWL
jgi:hypothetical protein